MCPGKVVAEDDEETEVLLVTPVKAELRLTEGETTSR